MNALRGYRRGGATRIAATALLAAILGAAVPGPASAVEGGGTEPTVGAVVGLHVEPIALPVIRDDQWQLKLLNAPAAWQLSTGRGVTVAVIDSGVDASHPDLAHQVLSGADLVAESGDGRSDPVGHGTSVAGLIAGGSADRGVTGLAPDAKILPVRVLDEENRYDDSLIVAKAVHWAVDNGAQVINLSLGGSVKSPKLAAAIHYAFDRDVVVVACTGNQTDPEQTEVWYPAREPGVIAVTGLNQAGDDIWSYSLTGDAAVLAAPATGLVGARPGGYWQVQGTSFAAPLVAATAALIRARWPQMSAGEVVNRLINTARDLGPAGRDATFGFGRVDPVAALTSPLAQVDHNPLDDDLSPAVVGFGPAPEAAAESASPAPQPQRKRFDGRIADISTGGLEQTVTSHEVQPLRWGGGVLLLLVAAAGGVELTRRSIRSARQRLRCSGR
ncbi:MAG TPA: type VII secretion-associated serine protease mycosin [Micromonosporaceae bacterium]|nr:type VII secretion-associated serine protease mycosin [Micromonosporaceae bacterium]